MVLRGYAILPVARASYIPLAYCRIYDKAVPCLFRINFCWSVLATFGNPAYECLSLVVLSAQGSAIAHSQGRVSIAPSHAIQPRYRLGDTPAFRQAHSTRRQHCRNFCQRRMPRSRIVKDQNFFMRSTTRPHKEACHCWQA